MKFLRDRAEFFVNQGKNNKIVTQAAAVVLAGMDINVYAETKTGEIDLEIACFSLGRVEVHEHVVVTSHPRSQDSGSFDIYYRNGGIFPFAPIQNEIRRVNAFAIPLSGIKPMTSRPSWTSERII